MSAGRTAGDRDEGIRLLQQPAGEPMLLQMQGIVKRYGANVALNKVDLAVAAGEIHALLGENGAGKSTLMHILSGLTRPNAGEIVLRGEPVRIVSPQAARHLGIAMVHQHFTLVPAFTVAENLALNGAPAPVASRSFPSALSRLHFAPQEAARYALDKAASLGWQLDPHARVASLSVGAQQRVEIVKALATDANLLIFDEPTAVLIGEEVEELFAVLRHLKSEGKAIILIAHKLAEILNVADYVTVLRRGKRIASVPVASTDSAQLAAWMIGPTTPIPLDPTPTLPASGEGDNSFFPPLAGGHSGGEPAGESIGVAPARTKKEGSVPDNAPILKAVDLIVAGDRGDQAVRGLNLEVYPGEIVGIGGVDGNGQTELAEALVGLRPLQAGALTLQASKVGYIPQDRRHAGLAGPMSVADNLLFEAISDPAFRRGPFLRRRALHKLAVDLIRDFDIRTPSPDLPSAFLSGGNQQKIVVARALRAQPEWIVAANPTRGLDIGATRFVHTQLRAARERGAAVLVITTDLDELAALADRTFVLSSGKLHSYVPRDVDSTQIGLLLGGISATHLSPASGAATPKDSEERSQGKLP